MPYVAGGGVLLLGAVASRLKSVLFLSAVSLVGPRLWSLFRGTLGRCCLQGRYIRALGSIWLMLTFVLLLVGPIAFEEVE